MGSYCCKDKNEEVTETDTYNQNNYYGYIDNKPISQGIKYGQYIKINKSKVLEMLN
jgi:hypothetical protein